MALLSQSPDGAVRFISDPLRPSSPYYNRAVFTAGFDSKNARFPAFPGGIQTVELLIPQQTEDIFAELLKLGFVPRTSLCYMATTPSRRETNHRVEKLNEGQSDYFFDLLELSGAIFSPQKRQRTRCYYCTPQFNCFVAYDSDVPAGWATMYVNKGSAFFANAYTIPEYRDRGVHASLLAARLSVANELGLAKVYTDVEPTTTSHRNCQKAGFDLLTVNSIWKRSEIA